MSAATEAKTIDARVLDLLADEIVVECVTNCIDLERRIQRRYMATASAEYQSSTEQNEANSRTRNAVFQARSEQDRLRERLTDRLRRRVEEIGRKEREAMA